MDGSDAKTCNLYAEAARAAVGEQADVLTGQAPAVRRETTDGVHDMRVAARRLRARLKMFKAALEPESRQAFSKTVRHIRKCLGAAREIDVCIELLDARLEEMAMDARQGAAWIRDRLEEARAAESGAVRDAADTAAGGVFERGREAVLAGIAPPPVCYVDVAGKKLRKRFKRLVKSYEKWRKNPEPGRLHRVRIRFKKLRYACETCRELYGGDMKSFIKELKEAQDILGDWNDYRVLTDYAREFARACPDDVRGSVDRACVSLDNRRDRLAASFEPVARDFFKEDHQKRIRHVFENPETHCPECG